VIVYAPFLVLYAALGLLALALVKGR